MAKRTALQRWQERMGFTQLEAAKALGMTSVGYGQLYRGRDYQRPGATRLPNQRTLLACAAIENGLKPIK